MSAAPIIDRDDVAVVIHDEMEAVRRSVAALGDAIRSLDIGLTPNMVKAVAQQEHRREALAAEFGLLTSVEAGARMGSRATAARRNAATAARIEGRLLAIKQGRYFLYPGFQFDDHGIRPVIADLKRVADEHGWDEASVIEWILAPTTYLHGKRPVDVLDDDELVVQTARNSMGTVW
jgi:hypothetical protein